MITIEKLRNFGADVDEGMIRCMNKEDFYLKLVTKAKENNKVAMLEEQIQNKDLKGAFETAHALKGMFANLALTPLAEPVSEITELLRKRTDTDYTTLLKQIKAQFDKLCSL